MSEYKEIKGKTVLNVGTDPSDTSAEGQVWYNSTAGAFKTVLGGGSWSSGTPLSTARHALSGFGTQTAGLAAGGQTTDVTEEYDGSGWAAGGNLSSTRFYAGSAGTQTAALIFGSYPSATTT